MSQKYKASFVVVCFTGSADRESKSKFDFLNTFYISKVPQ